ncbi:cob(I)yrinic acid a,c-diamide adenosyltransferase [Sphingomonas sp.]|uniref:cob(I)yrinic acid a,c-diamide adenosyltransferase n=1 Tax=Sphingomonas sp. TaxID=28214 RepID=UPI00286B2CA2|nr:cob(I)yrinic acid a,c-diamide adenosyltransferase [Sphingomonas sp.]
MVKLNKIYTRTGDAGDSGLVDGSRVSKASARMIAIGDVDEANSALGLAIAHLGAHAGAHRHHAALLRIQNELFDLGADLATPVTDAADPDWALRIVPAQVDRLEREIDAMNLDLAPLASFILPGGSLAVAAIHLARATVRRAERAAVALAAEARINPPALTYLNRLSDHLFVSARSVASDEGGDVLWRPGATRES